jgi:hypothetical protein
MASYSHLFFWEDETPDNPTGIQLWCSTADDLGERARLVRTPGPGMPRRPDVRAQDDEQM